MEFSFNRKVIGWTIVALILSLALYWLFGMGGLERIKSLFLEVNPPAPKITEDGQAAALGVAAFYSLSASDGVEGWQSRVCAVSTQSGCEFAINFVAPAFAGLFQADPSLETTATAVPLELVEDGEDMRVWRVEVSLDNPWEGFENPQEVYALVVRDGDTWKYERILLSLEVEARYKTTPTPQESQ
jgi:hypothetical protein